MKNVLFYFSYRPSYYLKHPLKFFHEIGINIHNAWNRISKGYCYIDVCNFDEWFLEVAPKMLIELSNGDGHPLDFNNHEEWHDWLYKQAKNLENCREEIVEAQNEYADSFFTLMDEIRENYSATEDFSELPEVIEARDKYFKRAEELYNERCELLKTTLIELSHNWFNLWD